MTHASRDTTTGLRFEEEVTIHKEGVNLTKNALYSYLKNQKINWEDLLSRKLLPDEAYYDGHMKKNINKQKVLPMKNRRLVLLKFGNIEKLQQLLVRKM